MSRPDHAVPARVVEPTDVLWRRVAAFVLDEVVVVAAGIVANAVLPGDVRLAGRLLAFVIVWLSVFVVVQGLTGATPGKWAAGIRVVDGRGRTPGLGRALVRSLAWVVDGLPYFLPVVGFTTAAADGHARRLGDRWAGTYVVAAELTGHPPFPTLHRADGSPPELVRTTADPLAPAVPAISSAPTTPPVEPTYDRSRGTYVRWDPEREVLVEFDEAARDWRPVPSG